MSENEIKNNIKEKRRGIEMKAIKDAWKLTYDNMLDSSIKMIRCHKIAHGYLF